jgi:lysophospholipase L1-like esterase
VPRVSPRAFGANLEEIIARARVFGARHIVLHTNHPTTRTSEKFPHTDLTYEDSNRHYNDIIRQIARQHTNGVTLVDIERHIEALIERREVDKLADLLLDDALHLSERGHDVYYRAISPVVQEMLFGNQ